MINQSANSGSLRATQRVSVILPGWADEASAIPHPAPLLDSVENAFAKAIGHTAFDLVSIPGAYCRWGGSGTQTTAPDELVCADPVHLLAGSDDAQLIPGQRLNINKDDSSALLAELNQVLGDEQGSFLHDFAGNWYYQGLTADALSAAPTSAVEGHPMTAAMPRSDAARPWRSLWSEVQMALHQSPINAARQARGEAPINSVWFWGGGVLPSPLGQTGDVLVFADDHVACGLSDALGVERKPLSAFESFDLNAHPANHFVVLDTQLLHHNPDFLDQLEVGNQWSMRLESMTQTDGELDGLTGCREVFVPASVKSRSVLSRLAQMFQRMTGEESIQVIRRTVPKSVEPLHTHSVLHRVFAARGVTDPGELSFALADLPRPDALPDLAKAMTRLVLAHKQHERVLVVGDYDCDGATSTALMMRALHVMGYEHIDYVIPDRALHGYGLSAAVIDVGIAQHDPSLIITVDNGVSANEAIDYATGKGIDVVVTDHHLPGEQLPNAVAVVNPSRSDSEFATRNIAGVGVAFYVLVALRRALHEAGCLVRNVRMGDWLDLVAIGTVADVVPLDSVNRILVEQGLRRIRSRQAVPGVLSLLDVSGREAANLSSTDIGMVLGPRLNAAGRIDDMRVGVQCLLADNEQEAGLIANTLQALNDQRRTIQSDMQEEAEAIVEALQANASLNDDARFAYAVHHHEWHQGVIGIVAGRLKDQLHLPVVVFSNDEPGLVKGSARSIPGVNIRDVFYRLSLQLPDAIERFGGHAMAAGLTLKANAFESFSDALNIEVAGVLDNLRPVKLFATDGALSLSELNLRTAQLVEFAAPWGTQFEAPLFDNRFIVESSRLVGNDRHAQLQLRPIDEGTGEAGSPMSAISFGDTRVFDSGTEVHAVYELSVNRYQGRQSVQMILRHLNPQFPAMALS